MSQLVPQHPVVGRRSVLFSSSSGGGGGGGGVVRVNSGLNAAASHESSSGVSGEERVADSFVPGSCRTPLLRFVVALPYYSLSYNKLYDKQQVIQQIGQLVAQQVHNKSTTDRSNGVRHLVELYAMTATKNDTDATRYRLLKGHVNSGNANDMLWSSWFVAVMVIPRLDNVNVNSNFIHHISFM